MGIVLSLFWPSTHRVADVDGGHLVEQALHELRESRHMLQVRIANKRRLIADVDRNMVELGLRMQNTANRLNEIDAQSFRREFRQKRLLVRSHGQFCTQLSNLDGQIMMLEDSPALEHSLESLHGGANAQRASADETRALIETVRADMASLLSTDHFAALRRDVDSSVGSMDDDALRAELDALMHNDEFIGQFDHDDLERARIALIESAPRVPHAPPQQAATTAAVGVAEMSSGLFTATQS